MFCSLISYPTYSYYGIFMRGEREINTYTQTETFRNKLIFQAGNSFHSVRKVSFSHFQPPVQWQGKKSIYLCGNIAQSLKPCFKVLMSFPEIIDIRLFRRQNTLSFRWPIFCWSISELYSFHIYYTVCYFQISGKKLINKITCEFYLFKRRTQQDVIWNGKGKPGKYFLRRNFLCH